MPNPMGWVNARRSPNPGASPPESSRNAPPAIARETDAINVLSILRPSNRTSRTGQTIIASEQMNPTLPAATVCSARIWPMYATVIARDDATAGNTTALLSWGRKGARTAAAIEKRSPHATDDGIASFRIRPKAKLLPYTIVTTSSRRRGPHSPRGPAGGSSSGITHTPLVSHTTSAGMISSRRTSASIPSGDESIRPLGRSSPVTSHVSSPGSTCIRDPSERFLRTVLAGNGDAETCCRRPGL
mmetsp:Transcript_60746/g.144571  ORF Transcript_60746/g.144571 Transcript_60746/m.144571 type:complete len:244 (-) Transcript_60746:110-841(-)